MVKRKIKDGVCVVREQKKGAGVANVGWFSPLLDALIYPMINPYGLEGYRWGKYKLYPKKTTTEQAFTEGAVEKCTRPGS